MDAGAGTANELHIGARTDFHLERFHVGEIDEVRISNPVKNASWIATEYNNQYDPIYGFLRQFASTGNSQWFELADDLAHHVLDIDIYHSKYDKAEYNGGLFWHTDHYLDAETSSHRSYSKLQKNNA